MSKVKIEGNASGTGTFTIAAPNSNTDRTITLPDEAGTMLTSASDLPAANLTGNVAAARITDALNASGSAPSYACRAWVNFNGTGTVAIRESGNVSSITDNGTGDYTVNFTTAMPDANYAGVVSGGFSGNVSGRTTRVGASPYVAAPTSSAFRILFTDSSSIADLAYAQAAFFR